MQSAYETRYFFLATCFQTRLFVS